MINQLFSRESVSEAAIMLPLPRKDKITTKQVRTKASRLGSSLVRHILFEFVEPNGRFRVARSAPVAARRKRAAGADLGTVRNRGALELTDLEKTEQKYFQPFLDRFQIVLRPFVGLDELRPGAAFLVAPGVPG